jgi:hypothetical protein
VARGYLHRVKLGRVADVSEIHAASIIGVQVSRTDECSCVRYRSTRRGWRLVPGSGQQGQRAENCDQKRHFRIVDNTAYFHMVQAPKSNITRDHHKRSKSVSFCFNYSKNRNIYFKKCIRNTLCPMLLCNICSKHFHSYKYLASHARDMLRNACGSLCKLPINFVRF